ncbi:hypothetical protein REPUB_Repub01dG0055000 [Reevesia pubescens]
MKHDVDLNKLAVKGMSMKKNELDLWMYDLDGLARAVLRKHMDVLFDMIHGNDSSTVVVGSSKKKKKEKINKKKY